MSTIPQSLAEFIEASAEWRRGQDIILDAARTELANAISAHSDYRWLANEAAQSASRLRRVGRPVLAIQSDRNAETYRSRAAQAWQRAQSIRDQIQDAE